MTRRLLIVLAAGAGLFGVAWFLLFRKGATSSSSATNSPNGVSQILKPIENGLQGLLGIPLTVLATGEQVLGTAVHVATAPIQVVTTVANTGVNIVEGGAKAVGNVASGAVKTASNIISAPFKAIGGLF